MNERSEVKIKDQILNAEVVVNLYATKYSVSICRIFGKYRFIGFELLIVLRSENIRPNRYDIRHDPTLDCFSRFDWLFVVGSET